MLNDRCSFMKSNGCLLIFPSGDRYDACALVHLRRRCWIHGQKCWETCLVLSPLQEAAWLAQHHLQCINQYLRKSFLFNASITHLEDPPQQRGTVIEEGTHSKFPLLFENIYRCRGVRAIKFSKDGDKHTGNKFWKRQSMDAAGQSLRFPCTTAAHRPAAVEVGFLQQLPSLLLQGERLPDP